MHSKTASVAFRAGDDGRWHGIREDFFRGAGLPGDPKEVAQYLDRRLGDAYDRFLQSAPANSYAVADESGWHLSVDATEKLDEEAQRSSLAEVVNAITGLDSSLHWGEGKTSASDGIDPSLLGHVSPIEWDNIVLHGQYSLDRKLVRRRRAAVPNPVIP